MFEYIFLFFLLIVIAAVILRVFVYHTPADHGSALQLGPTTTEVY